MTETTALQTSGAADGPEDKIKALTSIVERLENGMMAFSSTVISALTGQPQGKASSSTVSAPTIGAKRRGRPPGSVNRAKAPEAVEVKPPHPLELSIVDMLKRTGRMTQTELAHSLKKERATIEHHAVKKDNSLLERGEVVVRYIKPKGKHKQVLYYHPTWANFRGE
jgi:hypothetical protein